MLANEKTEKSDGAWVSAPIALLSELANPVMIHQEGAILHANASMSAFLGYGGSSRLEGQPLDSVCACLNDAEALADSNRRRVSLRKEDGTVMAVDLLCSPILWNGRAAEAWIVEHGGTAQTGDSNRLKDSVSLRVILDNLPIILFMVDGEGRFIRSDGRGLDSLGLKPGEIDGQSAFDLYGESNPHAREVLERCRSGSLVTTQFKVQDRSWRTVLSPVTDGSLGEVEILGLSIEVTEIVESQKSLAESEGLLKEVLDALPLQICLRDRSGRFHLVNRRFADDFDRPAASLIGESVENAYLIASEAAESLVNGRQVLESGREQVVSRHALTLPRKGLRFFHSTTTPIFQSANAEGLVLQSSLDITESLQDREALQAREIQLQAIMGALPVGVMIRDWSGTIRFANRAAANYWGLEPDNVANMSLLDLCDGSAEAISAVKSDRRVLRSGQRLVLDNQTLSLPGMPPRHFRVYKSLFPGRYQGREGVLNASVEITDMLSANEELNRLHIAVGQVPNPIFITDIRGTIVYANKACSEVTGYDPEEIMGNNPRMWKSDQTPASVYRDMWEKIRAGQVWRGEFLNRRKDGSIYEEEAVISPVRDAKGRIKYYVAIKQDITQMRLLERQVRQSNKMEAIGLLAGGIAHDFNNLLVPIGGQAEVLKQVLDHDSDAWRAADLIEQASHRASGMIRQLLGFARKGSHRPQPLNMDALVSEAIKLLDRTMDKSVVLRHLPSPQAATLIADASEVQQVIVNLGINARDAMPAGGNLTFQTSIVDLDEFYCGSHPGSVPGRYVRLSVTDTGTGIPRAQQDRVFEPFYTTKENGKGTGMGLSMAYGIVKKHGGSIRLYSEEGVGTVFHIYFPYSDLKVDAPVTPVSPPGVPDLLLNSTTLVVDDESLVRDAAVRILAHLGIRTLAASSGNEALEIYRDKWADIGMVFMDMSMPSMSGLECFHRLKEINPDVKVVLTTGYGGGDVVQSSMKAGVTGIIYKPYTLQELSSALARMLSGERSGSAV